MSAIERAINRRAALLRRQGKATSSLEAWKKADIEMESAFNLYKTSDHVIGSTGGGTTAATVYYQNTSHHGRVTQEHDLTTNVGRDFPKLNTGYTAQNELVPHRTGARMQYVEKEHGTVVHTSRNAFVASATTAEQQRLHSNAQPFGFKAKQSSVGGYAAYLAEKQRLRERRRRHSI